MGLVWRVMRDEDGMTRIFGYRLSFEMLLLWLIESAICFVVLFALLSDGAAIPEASGRALDGAAVLALTIGVVSSALGLYRPESCLETRRLMLKAVVAACASLPAIWLVGKLVHLDLGALFGWDPIWPLQMLIAWTALLLATRLGFGTAVRMGLFTRRVLLLGAETDAARTAAAIAGSQRGQFRIAATAASVADASLSPRDARSMWGVIVADDLAAELSQATLRAWRREGLRVLPETAFWERHLGRVDVAATRIGALTPSGSDRLSRGLSRLLDLTFASLLLLLTAPLMLLTALAVRLDSPGPVFYRQERVGLDGVPFTLVKFRSMGRNAEANGPVWAASGDTRVTRVGGFIRRVRIDELPQLFNILKGEMSLIGPRPERPHFVGQLAAAIPLYPERARVKPGLTGWAQVNLPYGASVDDARAKLSYDLYYVKHRSLFLDLMILLATIRVVLFQEGSR